jgi:(1->4)-alpha-D-glucan 1-alpha-D-glucosylmutase
MAELDAWQRREAGWSGSFPELARAQKRRLLDELFAGQVDALARGLVALAGGDRQSVDLTASGLRHALLAVTAALPVYRTYATSRGTSPAGRDLLAKALETARAEARVDRRALDFVGRVLSLDVSEAAHEQAQALVMDWQQLTGPAMAKGLEDTALYRDTRLLALDDVGRDPERDLPLTTPDAFHEAMLWRAEGWPRTMNATSTHDTKRSEDVRARIAVLSELAPEWLRELERWRRQNAPLRTMLADGEAPEPAMESLIYQTMLGAWPPAGAAAARGAFRERLRAYVLKAAREAKVRTTWLEPRRAYEEALLSFVDDCLDPARSSTFLGSLDRFAHLVTRAGATNSIAQTLLKLTVPGVPDIYQGTELVDLSLADPDNRRPIDFARRIALLGAMGRADSRRALLRELVRDWPDDRAKLLVTAEALALRKALPAVFEEGAYLPLAAVGERAGHAVAFARRAGEDWVIVVVPRLTARLTRGGRPPIGARPWGDTAVLLPEDAPRLWTDVLSGETRVVSPERGLAVGELFREFPGALLRAAG